MKLIAIAAALIASLTFASGADDQKASGSWTKKSHSIKGTWTIEGNTLSLKGLSTKSAPDLKLFLSPQPLAALSGKNATSGAKLIAKLKSPEGDQTYTLPDGVELSKFKTLIIHCEKYSKLWGGATLK